MTSHSESRQMNIYQVAHLAEIQHYIDPETGEINLVEFEKSQQDLVSKQQSCLAYYLNQVAATETLEAAVKRLQDKLKIQKSRNEDFKWWLKQVMLKTGTTEIKANDGTFTAKLELGRDKSVEIDANADVPIELCSEPKKPEPSKKKIKAALEAGQDLSYARIVVNDRLTIK
jgi:Siphovirus Gp157